MFCSIRKAIQVIIATGLAGMLTSPLFAQNGMSNARSAAMGGAYTAIARGVESPGWNPANLGLSGKGKYRLNLFSLGVGLRNNSFSKSEYDLYNGKYLTTQDKQDILNDIPAEGLLLRLNSEVQALGISFGSFALTATGMAASDVSVSRDITDLILNGNEFGKQYNIGDTGGEGLAYSSFAFSAGIPLVVPIFNEFSVGASAKYLKGFQYGVVREARSTLTTNIDGVHTDGLVVIDRAQGGSGFGLDIGVAGKLNKNVSFSLSASNIVSSMKWNTDPERFTYTFRADSASVQRIGDTDIDSVFIASDQTVSIDPFSASLPSQIRLGFARTSRRLTLGFSLSQGLRSGPGVSSKPRFAFGSEFRLIRLLPVRAGVAFGGDGGVSSSAGFALDFSFFSWDFAVESKGKMFGGKGLGLAFNWMFRL